MKVNYSLVKYVALNFSAIRCTTHYTTHYTTLQLNALKLNIVGCSTIQYCTISSDTITVAGGRLIVDSGALYSG